MKRLFSAALALALLMTCAGCTALFDREDYVLEDYEVPVEAADADEDAADTISNYAGLRRAIERLVSEHAESAQLQFQNYEGSIQQDISTACWEVKSSTALGAFAVDYISYDLSRIVSYYQAEIYITYKRAAYQVEAIEKVANGSALAARVDAALLAGETYLALEINSGAVTGDVARAAVVRAYYADPLACPVLPEVETALFPESGVSHILEMTLDYGLDGDTLRTRREELAAALEALVETIRPTRTEEDAGEDPEESPAPDAEELSAPDRIAALRAYFEENEIPDPAGGNTAWDALTQGAADSEGIAMAFEAGCRALGIECVVVAGRLDGEPHFWNIVTLGGLSYHTDASVPADGGPAPLFDDEQMQSRGYWWDTSEYPVCAEAYDPAAGTEEASPEPSGEPSGEPEETKEESETNE